MRLVRYPQGSAAREEATELSERLPSARHILIVNSRSVRQPAFVIGVPHSGADLVGRSRRLSRPPGALGTEDVAEICKLAGEELRRLGYAL